MLLQHVAATHIEQQECDCACAAICILLGATVGQVQDRLVSVVQRASSHTQRSVRCPHTHRETQRAQETRRDSVTVQVTSKSRSREITNQARAGRACRACRVLFRYASRRVAVVFCRIRNAFETNAPRVHSTCYVNCRVTKKAETSYKINIRRSRRSN